MLLTWRLVIERSTRPLTCTGVFVNAAPFAGCSTMSCGGGPGGVVAATSSRTLRVTRLTLPAASSTSISMWFAPWTSDTLVRKVPSVAGRTSVMAFCPGNARTVIRPSGTVTPLIRRSGCDAMTSPGGSVTSSRGGVANDVNW